MDKVTRRAFLGTGATALAVGVTADALAQEPAKPQAAKPTHLQAGKNTHENIIFACSGGVSNAGLVTWLAGFEVVKELGFKRSLLVVSPLWAPGHRRCSQWLKPQRR